MDLNRWSGIGRLTSDPEMEGGAHSPTRVVSFSISNERGRKDKKHMNCFICVAYTGLADLIMTHCKKGDRIGIDGELRQKELPDKKTGMIKEYNEIVIYNVQFLSDRNITRKESQSDFNIDN